MHFCQNKTQDEILIIVTNIRETHITHGVKVINKAQNGKSNTIFNLTCNNNNTYLHL